MELAARQEHEAAELARREARRVRPRNFTGAWRGYRESSFSICFCPAIRKRKRPPSLPPTLQPCFRPRLVASSFLPSQPHPRFIPLVVAYTILISHLLTSRNCV